MKLPHHSIGSGPRQHLAVEFLSSTVGTIWMCQKVLSEIRSLRRSDVHINRLSAPMWIRLADMLKAKHIYSKKTVWQDIHMDVIAKMVMKRVETIGRKR